MYPEILAQFSGMGNQGISRQVWNEQMNNDYALAQLGGRLGFFLLQKTALLRAVFTPHLTYLIFSAMIQVSSPSIDVFLSNQR